MRLWFQLLNFLDVLTTGPAPCPYYLSVDHIAIRSFHSTESLRLALSMPPLQILSEGLEQTTQFLEAETNITKLVCVLCVLPQSLVR